MPTSKFSKLQSAESNEIYRAHLFSPLQPEVYFRQSPGSSSIIEGVRFTVGLDVPDDIDVLIVVGRGSFSIPTNLPRERIIFCEVEPDEKNPRNSRFLNQFGIVITSSCQKLTTEKWHQCNFNEWFVGIDFSNEKNNKTKNYNWFLNLDPYEYKLNDKISVVTSNRNKKNRPYYEKRLKFIRELQNLIPDHLEIYGRGFRSIGDKADAILPNKYHLALENCSGKFTWTEKIADPILCWAYTFYFGCTNLEDDIPKDSFSYIDLADPRTSAEMMVQCLQNKQWEKSLTSLKKSRELILHKYNIMFRFTNLVNVAMKKPIAEWPKRKRLIRSDRSLRPDGYGKGTVFDWLLRSSLILIYPTIELKLSGCHYWYLGKRVEWNAKKIAKAEKQMS